MSIVIAQTIAELRTRIERLEALEVPEQVDTAAHVAYLAVGGGDYGLLRIDENGDETLLNSGLPAGCSVVEIAVSPIDTDRIAVLVNFPDNPYPLFAIQGGVVIRGDPANGYPTSGGPCLYVAGDGATFTAVALPTSNGNSAGRVAMGINGLEWSGTTLVIVGAVEYFWDGVVTANNVLWRWSSGASATIQFETTGAMSVPFKTIVGQDEDAITLEMINPFASSSERIAYATGVAANWTVQHTGTALGIYAGADLLPDSRSLVAGYDSGNIVLLADYRVAGAPSVISTTALRATIAPYGGFPDFALAFWLSAATHGVYYIDTSDHLQKISDPTGTPTTAQIATDQIPNAAVIGFVRAARQNRRAVAAVDPAASFVYITTDGSTWSATEITSYTITGPVEVVDLSDGTYPSPHALSGDRHFGTLSSSQHSSQPGGTLHDAATTSVAGFLSAADKTTIDNLATTFAPIAATYITQTPSGTLTAEQALSLLSSGYAKITTATGLVSTVAAIPASDLSGQVAVANGGTSFSSYTTGDLIQASAAGTLAKLAAVATGNALISGGVGTVSSWGKIGLTTHISGVLAAPNGGTDQSSYAVGDLLYASTTTALSKLAAVAVGSVLRAKGTNTAPAWEALNFATDGTGLVAPANGGSGTANTGNLAWPSGGGTAALLATANVFTADQTIQPSASNTAAIMYVKATSTVGGAAGNAEARFQDGIALTGRLVSASANVSGSRYFGFISGADRDGEKYPIRFFTQNAAGTGTDALFIGSDAIQGYIGIGTPTPGVRLHLVENNATTNAVDHLISIDHNTTGTAAAGFGSGVLWRLESSTTTNQSAALLSVSWATATHASRKALVVASVYDTAAREGWRIEASGTAPLIGFLGAAAVVRQVVTGSRGGNAALASFLTGLANLGLITDSTTA